jgi:uncharacterized protein (TIGR01777 family)
MNKLNQHMLNKIVIAGANGFLGSVLTDYFSGKAKQVVLLSRKPIDVTGHIIWQRWDGETIGAWASSLEQADVVINLAGKNVNCRYTVENKKLIYESRLKSTRVLGEAIASCQNPPKLWINASSATIYRASYDKMMTETEGEIGDDFSMDVCKQWEAAYNAFKLTDTRKLILRTSIVLGRSGGALPPLLNLVKTGLGGYQGDGRQFCSWIHERDFCRAVEWLINTRHAEGIFNVTAPIPLTNTDFMGALRKALKIPLGIITPRWLLEAGAVFIRTETELILKSRKVFPKRLLDEGFVFEFKEANDALDDLCRKEARIKQSSTLSH